MAVTLTQDYISRIRLVLDKGDMNWTGMGYYNGHSFLPCIDVLGSPTASRSEVRCQALNRVAVVCGSAKGNIPSRERIPLADA